MNTRTSLVILTFISALMLGACESEGPAEKAGKQIDNAISETGSALEEAADSAGEKLEEAGDEVRDATN
ncbi:MAG: hypothetical protein ACPG4N_13840 [Gammaproteobacteria bacterium]